MQPETAKQRMNDIGVSRENVQDLGLDYVDLMLIHQPGWNDEEVYRAMEQAVRDGKVRAGRPFFGR